LSTSSPSFGSKTGYGREDILRIAGITRQQLHAWERQGFLRPAETFEFADILALKTLKRLRELKIPAVRIKQAINALLGWLEDVRHPLSQLRITAEGKRITVHLSGNRMEAITGQLLLDFDGDEIEKLRTFAAKPVGRTKALDEESERWFQRGLTLEETGAPVAEAIAAYKKAIDANPDAAGALVNLGTISFRAKRLKEAADLYHRALKADPEYPLAHFNLGNLNDELGNAEEARAFYARAIKLNPRYADAYFNLALLHEKHNELIQAIGCWQHYLRLDATSTWAKTARKQLDRLKNTVRHK
jgi:tetratricopeptide (TPR) repeat protein